MKTRQSVMIKREEAELEALIDSLPDNPIPWLTALRLVAPLLARLAVRYALRRTNRSLSEERISTVADTVSARIAAYAALKAAPGA